MSGETRARRRIREAIESRGYSIETLEWTPWYDGGEMVGLCGGWWVTLDRPYLENTWPGNELSGYSVEECLSEVDYWLRPADPCQCPNAQPDEHGFRYAPTRPLKGSPTGTIHLPECPWFIRYRMPWWKDVA